MKKTYNVNIKIDSEIPGNKAQINITGDDDKKVEECFNRLNITVKSYEIKYGKEAIIKQYIPEILEKYNLVYKNFT